MFMAKKRKHKEFLILMALMDGPKHGYEVSKHIEEKSNGFFKMPFSTLYPILHSLEKSGFVSMSLKNKESLKPKKVYRLTKKGEKQAHQEVEEFDLFFLATKNLVPS